MMRLVIGSFALMFLDAVVLPARPALAQTMTRAAEDGKIKIDLAGRQRMLTQQMAKDACFALLKVQADRHREEMLQAHDRFTKVLAALESGSPEQKMLPETDSAILEGLRAVAGLWVDFGSAVKSIANGKAGQDVARVYELNVPIMLDMDTTVSHLEHKFDDVALLRPGLANAINVAGRQRMLSQKMSKEFCMIASKYEVDLTRVNLLGTLALFRSSQAELSSRLDELKLAQDQKARIQAQYSVINGLWTAFDAVMTNIMSGAQPSGGDIAYVADASRKLLVELEAAVKLYQSVE